MKEGNNSRAPGAGRGRLKLFFGYAPGAGKTYAMLDDAKGLYKSGADVLIGTITPRAYPETLREQGELPWIPAQAAPELGQEFDLDYALRRRPRLLLIDDLAHANPPGFRNKKRYQDVEELLNAGVDVYATVSVEQIESLCDVVEEMTGIRAEETIPDAVFDRAELLTMVDIEPADLLRRLAERSGAHADDALRPYLDSNVLRQLREIALRKAADRISRENLIKYRMPAQGGPASKFLVCVGPSPSSATCIRWTAGIAEALRAPWVALYVERMDGGTVPEAEKRRVRENMALAETLGAECVTLNGGDVALVVAEYAALSGTTDIVVGKSRNKKTLKSLFDLDFEDKLISLLPSVEVHMLPDKAVRQYHPGKRPLTGADALSFSWTDFFRTVGLLLAATAVCVVLRTFGLDGSNVPVFILTALLVSRVTSGYGYGVASSIVSVLISDYFFTPPLYRFNFLNGTYPLAFLIMLVAALLTSALTVRMKSEARQSVAREWRTQILYEINKKLLVTEGAQNIAQLSAGYTESIFRRSVVFYTDAPERPGEGVCVPAPEEDPAPLLTEKELSVARWVFRNHKNAGRGTDTSSRAAAFYMPVSAQGQVAGVMGISAEKGELTADNRLFLSMIATQVAMALERQRLSDETRRILIESEKEKMRSNLLRAISHDLRTPLTGISGAASAILENGERLSKETHDTLIGNIRDDAQWLIRMVENLLFVTRIGEAAGVVKSTELAEEVVSEAVRRVRKRFPGQKMNVRVPDEMLLVPMDGMLIEQVLINLIENAIKHSPADAPVEVRALRQGNEAVFEVSDHGGGIAGEELPHVFESYAEGRARSADSTRGMGIGLSICMTIVKAHQGKMEAENLAEGGAVFRFTLPLEGEEAFEQPAADPDYRG